MSWIRPKTEEPRTEPAATRTEPNYNRDMQSPDPAPRTSRPAAGNATIGRSIHIEGTLTGSEDLTIDGTMRGNVKLNGHALTVGPNGKIEAAISAKTVNIQGRVKGNITADDKIRVGSTSSVAGDLRAPRIALDDGASFAGHVDTGSRKPAAAAASNKMDYAAGKR